jgi:hypothetical protein
VGALIPDEWGYRRRVAVKRLRRLLLILSVAWAASSGTTARAEDPARPGLDPREKRARLLEIYKGEAARYTIYRDAAQSEMLTLRVEPVYVWTNPVRSNGTDGAVFVWTCRGRAEVIGSFFSFPATGPRRLYHELHSLATTVLDVSRAGDAPLAWQPEAPGITLAPIAGAPVPAPSPVRRLAQMRTLSGEFSARSLDFQGRHWDLRLLPQPLYRYESTDPEILDGAVFSFVTSAGTDPEILLIIEARSPGAGGAPSWHYALGRFSDLDLWVQHKGKEVYTAARIPFNSPEQDPKGRYRSFRDREIPAVEEPAP